MKQRVVVSKYKPARIVGKSVIWWRYGSAALGEPRIVEERVEYPSDAAALRAVCETKV